MNNKGLTLVEVIAVLVILSIIAVIVTPNIAVSVRDYKDRTTQTQLSTIKEATKNWVADNVNKINCDGTTYGITVKKLQTEGYLDKNLKNPNGGTFDDSTDTFGLVYCTEIIDETGNMDSNYKYEYGAYIDLDDYVKKMAIKYVKNKKILSNTSVTVTTLINERYLHNIINMDLTTNKTVSNKTISVEVTEDEVGEYQYNATIN